MLLVGVRRVRGNGYAERCREHRRGHPPATPVIGRVGATFQNGIVRGDVLADTGQVEGVESAECREVRGRESRLGHVEVFRVECVRTSIIGMLRPLSV